MNEKWLHPCGLRFLDWLRSTPNYHAPGVLGSVDSEEKSALDTSEREWATFVSTRVHAHYAMDPQLNENVLPTEAHKDGKQFEDTMQAIVGKKKKDELMQLELKMSLPILKKYPRIMSKISSILWSVISDFIL